MNAGEPILCKFCKAFEPPVVEVCQSGPHYAKGFCAKCGRYLDWVKKPDSEKVNRPAAQKDLAIKYGRGFCELCRCPEEYLAKSETLAGHHVIEYADGGEPNRENIWVTCTSCHGLIHWRRMNMKNILARIKNAKPENSDGPDLLAGL